MKKLITLLLSLLLTTFGNLAFAAHHSITPEQPIVLFYDVPEVVIDNYFFFPFSRERTGFEKSLKYQYRKRFNVRAVRPVPQPNMSLEEYRKILKEDQLPLILTISPIQSKRVPNDPKKTHKSADGGLFAICFTVNLTESFPDLEENRFIDWDYSPYDYYETPITGGCQRGGFIPKGHSICSAVDQAIHAACKQDIRAGYTPSAD